MNLNFTKPSWITVYYYLDYVLWLIFRNLEDTKNSSGKKVKHQCRFWHKFESFSLILNVHRIKKDFSYLSYLTGYSSLKEDSLKIIAGTMMASMSQTNIHLPKITHHLPTKIVTVFLNSEQIGAIRDSAKWKILSAPFGGGKTVVLSEIAKCLLKVLLTLFCSI